MKNKKELLERIERHTEEEDFECYMLVTDKGISVNGNTAELLTLLSSLEKRLMELGIAEELIKEATRIAFLEPKDVLLELKGKLNEMLGDK